MNALPPLLEQAFESLSELTRLYIKLDVESQPVFAHFAMRYATFDTAEDFYLERVGDKLYVRSSKPFQIKSDRAMILGLGFPKEYKLQKDNEGWYVQIDRDPHGVVLFEVETVNPVLDILANTLPDTLKRMLDTIKGHSLREYYRRVRDLTVLWKQHELHYFPIYALNILVGGPYIPVDATLMAYSISDSVLKIIYSVDDVIKTWCWELFGTFQREWGLYTSWLYLPQSVKRFEPLAAYLTVTQGDTVLFSRSPTIDIPQAVISGDVVRVGAVVVPTEALECGGE